MSEEEPLSTSGSTANAEIARMFAEIGDILEIKGEPPYRYNAYRTGARSVANATERLETLFQEGRLRQLQGVGAALESKIVEYLSTGRMDFHEQVRRDFPVALASLLEIPGLGPGRARAVYQELGVSTLTDLEAAARSGRLQDVPGFGRKAIDSLLENLARLKQRSSRGLLSDAWLAFSQVQEAIGETSEQDRIAVVGSVRRMQDSVGGLDLLAGRDTPAEAEALIRVVVALPNLVQVLDRSSDEVTVQLYGGLEVRLNVVPRDAWGSALVWYTGSRAHVARLEALARERGWNLSALGLEDDATGKLLEPPELRQDEGEIEAGRAGSLPRLVELSDIKGDLHTHTNWTDGTQPLEDMAKAAKAKGYQYMALTDHTQNLALTRGLTPERLEEERALVKRVNQKLAPFVVLYAEPPARSQNRPPRGLRGRHAGGDRGRRRARVRAGAERRPRSARLERYLGQACPQPWRALHDQQRRALDHRPGVHAVRRR